MKNNFQINQTINKIKNNIMLIKKITKTEIIGNDLFKSPREIITYYFLGVKFRTDEKWCIANGKNENILNF